MTLTRLIMTILIAAIFAPTLATAQDRSGIEEYQIAINQMVAIKDRRCKVAIASDQCEIDFAAFIADLRAMKQLKIDRAAAEIRGDSNEVATIKAKMVIIGERGVAHNAAVKRYLNRQTTGLD
jgi:hypothetical protein